MDDISIEILGEKLDQKLIHMSDEGGDWVILCKTPDEEMVTFSIPAPPSDLNEGE